MMINGSVAELVIAVLSKSMSFVGSNPTRITKINAKMFGN